MYSFEVMLPLLLDVYLFVFLELLCVLFISCFRVRPVGRTLVSMFGFIFILLWSR